MQIIEYDEFGGPEVLHVAEVAIPAVGPGEVLVQVEAAGINFADIMQRRNAYLQPTALPAHPGSEIAGTVTEVGTDVTSVAVGTQVTAFLASGGGYAEYVAAPATAVIVLPPNFPTAQAPALHVQGLTAYLLLKHAGHLAAGETVVVQSLACLAPFGRLLTYGNSSGQPSTLNTGVLLAPNQAIIGFYLGGYFAHPAFIQEAYGFLIEHIASGALHVQVDDVFPLAHAAEAHRRIEARQTTGKVILQP